MNKISKLLLAVMTLTVVSCGTTSTVPVTGRKQHILVSDEEVLGLSNKEYTNYMKTAKVSTNATNTAMVKRVGQRLATAVEQYLKANNQSAELKNYNWEFNLVQDNSANAFCMPGGKIVVYEGLLPITQNESALAIVLGHEIAHAVAAGGAGGSESLDIAIITKLSRVLLLAPAAIVIGVWYRKAEGVEADGKGKVPIPWFMVGFVAASVIGTFAPLTQEMLDGLVKVSYLLLGMAMAALGMTVTFRVLLTRGRNAFVAALITSVVLLAFVAGMALLFC